MRKKYLTSNLATYIEKAKTNEKKVLFTHSFYTYRVNGDAANAHEIPLRPSGLSNSTRDIFEDIPKKQRKKQTMTIAEAVVIRGNYYIFRIFSNLIDFQSRIKLILEL